MAQATAPTKVRVDQIEGLREFVSRIMVEEGDKVLRQIALEDVEQIRRSPVGAIIRLEEKVDHIYTSLSNFREDTKANMSTLREDMDRLRSDMEKGFSNLRGEMHALFAEQGERVTFLQRVVFAVFSLLVGLQIAILVKLFL